MTIKNDENTGFNFDEIKKILDGRLNSLDEVKVMAAARFIGRAGFTWYIDTYGCWNLIKPIPHSKIRNDHAHISISPRPFHCDRGRYFALVDMRGIDYQDGLPKYGMIESHLMLEMQSWLNWRLHRRLPPDHRVPPLKLRSFNKLYTLKDVLLHEMKRAQKP